MTALRSMTTEYVAAEDRLRLTAELAPGKTIVLWLTQRLIAHILPPLCAWLERQNQPPASATTAAPTAQHNPLLQSFAQQAARASQPQLPPLSARSAQQSWLVTAVNLTSTPHRHALRLTFSGTEDESASAQLAVKPLRHWLNILHAQWRLAGWPLNVWPDWIAPFPSAPVAPFSTALH